MYLFSCFHVTWPSDSKPTPNYIAELNVILLLLLFYMNIYYEKCSISFKELPCHVAKWLQSNAELYY